MTGTFRRAPLLITFGPEDGNGDLDGLWVKLVRLSVGDLREIVRIAGNVKEGSTEDIDTLADKLGKVLVDWNWTDPYTGEPVDARAPGAVDTLDSDVMMMLTDRLQGAVGGVDKDLGKGSRSTDVSRGNGTNPAPIPVTGTPGLSSALANLPTHSPFTTS